ncbi:unnamed protein product [Paramecium primaurelia]|uniref:Transmembrane protein n=1 Tax=Paramecium primaurelia TaxID=5886 RepID=A0A8S1P5K8_PARPR|nr:unnamed protein product [Paramecium primaurelia]
MYLIFIIELFLIQRSYSNTCQNISISPNQYYYSYYPNLLILEANVENFNNVQSINMEIVKKSFAIPYHQNFLALQIINPFQMKNKIQDKLICQLFKVDEYSINCIESHSIFFDQKDEFKLVIQLQTQNISQDYCDYMHFDETKQIFILLCHNYPMFKIYEVNIHNETTLLQQLNLTIQFQEKCKRAQYLLNDQTIIIAFHKCTHWMILITDQSNKQIQILLDYQYNLMKDVLLDFYIVNEIQFCETTSTIFLYFIEQNRYASIQITRSQINIQQYFIYIATNLIQKLIINSKCSLKIPIIYNQEYSENTTIVKNSEFVLYNLYEFNDINYIQNYLFLKRNTELIVDITKYINQTYQIETTPLIFLEQLNLFYQINPKNKIIQFYRISSLRKIFKPREKYIFLIDEEQQLIGNTDNIQCIKIDYKDKDLNNIFDIETTFNCKMKFNSQVSKE